MQTTLFTGIIFLGFLALLVGGFYAGSYSIVNVIPNQAGTGNNDSSFNLISGQGTNFGASVPTCSWGRDIDIPILGGLIWGGACISSYIGFLFDLMFVQTNIPWLQIVILGLTAVIGYAIVRLLRGGG